LILFSLLSSIFNSTSFSLAPDLIFFNHTMMSPIFSWRNWGTEKWSDSPQIPQATWFPKCRTWVDASTCWFVSCDYNLDFHSIWGSLLSVERQTWGLRNLLTWVSPTCSVRRAPATLQGLQLNSASPEDLVQK
jgi:hypothetical protein